MHTTACKKKVKAVQAYIHIVCRIFTKVVGNFINDLKFVPILPKKCYNHSANWDSKPLRTQFTRDFFKLLCFI